MWGLIGFNDLESRLEDIESSEEDIGKGRDSSPVGTAALHLDEIIQDGEQSQAETDLWITRSPRIYLSPVSCLPISQASNFRVSEFEQMTIFFFLQSLTTSHCFLALLSQEVLREHG